MTDISTLPLLANASVADDDWTIIYDTSDGLLKRIRKDGLTAEQAADIDMISQWGGGNKTVENNLTIGDNFRANGTSRLVGDVTADGDVDVSGDVDATDVTASGNAQVDGNLTLAGDLTLTDKTQIQADWNETTSANVGFIKNKPTVPAIDLSWLGDMHIGIITMTGATTGTVTTITGDTVTFSVSAPDMTITHNLGENNYFALFTISDTGTASRILVPRSRGSDSVVAHLTDPDSTSGQVFESGDVISYLFITV